jgi:hypothetical protein
MLIPVLSSTANRRMVYFAKRVKKTKDNLQNIQDNAGMNAEMCTSEKRLKMTQGGWSFQ